MQRLAALAIAAALLLAGCGGGSIGTSQPAPPATNPPQLGPPEYRAFWVDAFHPGIKTPQQADALIQDALRANINALFVQVRRRGDAYFNIGVEPRTSDPEVAPIPYDPLAYVIQQAHAASPRLEVHAWMNVYSVGTDSAVWRQHSSDWANLQFTGATAAFLDPGVPEVNTYTAAVILDLLRNYDVDGIHLDYVRYPDGGDWGYNPAAVARFNAQFSRIGTPIPSDAQWKQFRRDQVTGFVSGLYTSLLAIKPQARLTAALIAWGAGPVTDADWQTTAAYNEVYQDWYGWLQRGALDLGLVMNYDAEWSATQRTWFNQWIEWEKDHQAARRLLVGVGAFLNYPEDTFAAIQRVRAASARGNQVAGVAIYSYASSNAYSNSDYYTSPSAYATLPRQPYAAGLDAAGLAARAANFNNWFYGALSQSATYNDPALGAISTQPPFSLAAPLPTLPWK